MRRLGDLLNEDTNQFGPGTDLIVSVLAVLLVLTLVVSYSYAQKQRELKTTLDKLEGRGDFRLAKESFQTGTFFANPATRLINPAETDRRVRSIVDDYRRSSNDFPYLFVIGHANQLDDPTAADQSRAGRLARNWEIGGRRAAVIAAHLEAYLRGSEVDRLVVTTTGELDQRNPTEPTSHDNSWVEVIFGRVWKPPSESR